MGRPKRKDKLELIDVKCSFCLKVFQRERYKEERRKKLGKRASCSYKCSGRLGGLVACRSTKRL